MDAAYAGAHKVCHKMLGVEYGTVSKVNSKNFSTVTLEIYVSKLFGYPVGLQCISSILSFSLQQRRQVASATAKGHGCRGWGR